MSADNTTFIDALNHSDVSQVDCLLPFVAGIDPNEQLVIKDLSKLQHLIIAGASGMGKSNLGHEIILSLMHTLAPDDARIILCDTKMVEYHCYDNAPHLLIPVATDPGKIDGIIQWAETETLRRLSMISQQDCRSIEQYNSKMRQTQSHPLSRIVVLIDDAADAIETTEQMNAVISLAINSRAAGIHLVLITQNPSDKHIAEIIKSSIPNRATFALINDTDKRLLFGSSKGAFPSEIGYVYFTNAIGKQREQAQTYYITNSTINTIVEDALQKHGTPAFAEISEESCPDPPFSQEEREGDEMLPYVMDLVMETGNTSISTLQARLKLGYARTARLIEEMETKGLIGPFRGAIPREILVTPNEWQQIKARLLESRCFLADDPKQGMPNSFVSTPANVQRYSVKGAVGKAEPLPQQKKQWYHRVADSVKKRIEKTPQIDPLFAEMENASIVLLHGQEDDFLKEHPLVDEVYTKVVGVTFDNDDGSSRQEIIEQCKSGESVLFRFFTFNNEPAIAVHTQHGQIGFLSARLADRIECDYGCDIILLGIIEEITGGDGLNYGCNLHLLLFED